MRCSHRQSLFLCLHSDADPLPTADTIHNDWPNMFVQEHKLKHPVLANCYCYCTIKSIELNLHVYILLSMRKVCTK